MASNVWVVVAGVPQQLVMEALLGTSNQLMGMNTGATAVQYKNVTFNNATGQLAVPIGSAAVPPYTFTGQLGSGWFWDGTLGLAVGGVKVLGVSGTLAQWSTNVQFLGKLLQEDLGADIAASATTDLGTATGNILVVTNAAGATVVTSLGGATIPAGTEIETIFSITGGSISLTHNATSLILLGEANTPLVDKDIVRWRKINDASPYWRMVGFQRGLASTNFTTKGDLLVGEEVGALVQAAILPRGNDGEVLKTDSSVAKGLIWGAIASPPVRQTVLSAALTAAGLCNLVSAGAALNYNIEASPTSALLTFAQGFGASGQVDSFSFLTADEVNVGALVANNTNYLHATRVSSSAVTWSSALVPPDYGYSFDRTRGALLNFEGADTSTTFIDDFGNSWSAAGNAQIDTAQFKFGTSSLLLDGTDKVTSTNYTTLGDSSWETSLWFRITTLPGVGANTHLFNAVNAAGFGYKLFLNNNAGIIRLACELSSNGTSADVASTDTGTNTVWTLNQWNKVRFVFDVLGGTYKTYLSLNGAAETEDNSVTSTAKICAITGFHIGEFHSGGSGLIGWIDAFRFIRAATVTTTETPAAVAPTITDHPYHFFSIPEMKMYEVTASSVTPAMNPTLTARNRLFVGEADTGAGAVTAVRNYAIRGEYISEWSATPAASTIVTKNSNLGTIEGDVTLEVRNVTATGGWKPFETAVVNISGGTGTDPTPASTGFNNINTIFAISPVTNGFCVTNKTTFVLLGTNTANWQYRLKAKRTF